MKNKFILSVLVLSLLFAGESLAQSAGDYFNRAARSYVKTERENALKEVNDGLGKFPDDAKLKALKEKLEKEQEEEDQGHEQRHVVLVQAQAVVLDPEGGLEDVHEDERPVRAGNETPREEEQNREEAHREVEPEDRACAGGAEEAEIGAALEEGPADRERPCVPGEPQPPRARRRNLA